MAVVPMLADTTCCLAASYPAKRFGVKTGTSIRDARRLCPGIVFVQADHRKYIRYHKRIIETVDKHLPVKRIMSIDEMACELIGKECQEEFVRLKSAEIKTAIAREISPALTCSIGVAPNRYLAKVASDMQKPDGLTIIHEHEIMGRLSCLEPRDFPGIGPRMEERFHARGCFSAAHLFAMTPREMAATWGGVLGERFFQLIRGVDLPDEDTERSSISHSKVLSPDSRSPEAAWPVAVRLLTKACVRLRNEGLYTRELHLSIKFLDRDPTKRKWYRKIKCFETNDSLLLLEHLERLWREMPGGTILRVGVALSNLAQAAYHQPGLFEDPKRESLMSALDAVNQRYKDGAIYVADAHSALRTSTNSIAFQRIPGEDE